MRATRKGLGQPPRPLHPGRRFDWGVWIVVIAMLAITAASLLTTVLHALGWGLGLPVEATA